MRLPLLGFVFALLWLAGGSAPCFGQQRPVAIDAWRLQGTLARPADCVRHPDLDSAWTEYGKQIAEASSLVKKKIKEMLDAAAAAGNLNQALIWQKALEKFEQNGIIPNGLKITDPKTARPVGETIEEAQKQLTESYEAIVKVLTNKQDLQQAKQIQDEAHAVGCVNVAAFKALQGGAVFLCDLPDRDAVVGWGNLGKGEKLGWRDAAVQVQGVPYRKSVSMHPPKDGIAKVSFAIPKGLGLTHFKARAAINDGGRNTTPLTFKVVADDKLLWKSRPLRGGGSHDDCAIALEEAKTITLAVECPGNNGAAWAVWCDPRFVDK
jgi:hypothetical protein